MSAPGTIPQPLADKLAAGKIVRVHAHVHNQSTIAIGDSEEMLRAKALRGGGYDYGAG